MNLPIVLLCGQAGSGKSTAAGILRERCGAIELAQADPLKRVARDLFGFSTENLWGPSARREEMVIVQPVGSVSAMDRLSRLFREIEYDAPSYGEEGDAFQAWYRAQIERSSAAGGRLAVRGVIRTFGTEFGRKILGEDVWSQHALTASRRLLRGGYAYTPGGGLTRAEHAAPAPLVAVSDGRFVNEVIGAREAGAVPVLVRGRRTDTANDNHRSESELATIPEHFFGSVLDNTGSLASLEYALEDLIAAHFSVYQHGDYQRAGVRCRSTYVFSSRREAS